MESKMKIIFATILFIAIVAFLKTDCVKAIKVSDEAYWGGVYMDSNRFIYDGKIHKPTVNIYDADKTNHIDRYNIKYSNPNSNKVGRYKVTLISKDGWDKVKVYYEIVKGSRSVSKTKKDIRKFFKSAKKCAKTNLKSLASKFCEDKGIVGKLSSFDKKIIRKKNKKCLKIKIKKMKINKNNLAATVKIQVKYYSYSNVINRAMAICYKDALKHNYIDTKINMMCYHYNKNFKKALKMYSPKKKTKTISVQMVKIAKRGWKITGDDYEVKNASFKVKSDGDYRFIGLLTCDIYASS